MSVVRCDSADYEWLPRLTALTDLRMSECDALPGGLGELTWLRGLEASRSHLGWLMVDGNAIGLHSTRGSPCLLVWWLAGALWA